MALPVETQLRYWTIAAVVFFGILWLLGDVIMPFILAGALAYCLDPIADWLERLGCSRIWAVVVITLTAIFMFVLMILLVLPTLSRQAVALFEAAPQVFRDLQTFFTTRFPDIMESNPQVQEQLASFGQTIREKGAALLNGIVSSVSGFVNLLVLMFLVPIITFYLLLDWDRLVSQIDELLPRDHAPTIRRLSGQVDETLAAFIRGQGTVCLLMGVYYAVGLGLVGLNFGLVVGAVAGLITFIPYVGALVGGALAIGLALFQYWGALPVELADGSTGTATDWVRILIVAGIFFSGQAIEGNFLTPNLVGNSVGLHPVTLIFALSAFGALFGFTGLLVAVPVSAAFGVLVRFAVQEYKAGKLYQGWSHNDAEDADDDPQ